MVACIDGDFIPFISCYNKPDKDGIIKEKSLEEAIIYCDSIIDGILRNTKADSYIIALTKGKCFRYNIYPEYKANRKYKQQLKYFKEIKQHLIDKYQAIWFEQLEADDIVNICRLNYEDGFIVSVDKDLLSLEGEHYNPRIKQWIVTSKSRAEYEFCFDMIVGQPGDNIKGIKGKGPVYAENIFNTSDINPNLLDIVFNSYLCNYSSREEAIDEFYRNFKCLNIVSSWEGFNIPEPKKITTLDEYESEKRVVKE